VTRTPRTTEYHAEAARSARFSASQAGDTGLTLPYTGQRVSRVGWAGATSALLLTTSVAAQQGGAISVLTHYPAAHAFDPRSAPASALQHRSMVAVSAGAYPIRSPAQHPQANEAAMPAHQVPFRAFRIDRTEVTNAQFAEFLNALPVKPSGTAHPGAVGRANISADRRWLFESGRRSAPPAVIELDDDNAQIGIRDDTFAPAPGREQHPVTETTWAGALAYCNWRGGRLPTEVEWEAAARGREGRTFPWGEAMPTTELAVIQRRTGDTVPVGSRPQGATSSGLLDMAGSLSEWTSTLDRPYPYRSDDGREDPSLPGERVVRGGDYVFNSGAERLTTWNRTIWSRNPLAGHRHIGFRCAAGD
jgi:formylglycine-generating enzyme required for sulfatase activity